MNDRAGSVGDALALAEHDLELTSPAPRLDAEVLLADLLGKERAWLYAHPAEPLEPSIRERLRERVARRLAGVPIAYITGNREFWSLPLRVNPDTLIPRPETELLVETALERLPQHEPVRLLELGTGCGAISLALARERPDAAITATDASRAALDVARDNARRLGLDSVTFLCGDWFEAVTGLRYDLIVCNPPYVRDDDEHLRQGDCRFEPRSALTAGPGGLDAIRRIAAEAGGHLVAGGHLLLEHGPDQRNEVVAILSDADFRDIRSLNDLAGLTRVVTARYG